MSIKEKILAFVREEEGLTTVEYAVAGAIVVVGVIAAFDALREAVIDRIGEITTELGG